MCKTILCGKSLLTYGTAVIVACGKAVLCNKSALCGTAVIVACGKAKRQVCAVW